MDKSTLLRDVEGFAAETAEALEQAGIKTIEDLHNADDDRILAIDGIGKATLEKLNGLTERTPKPAAKTPPKPAKLKQAEELSPVAQAKKDGKTHRVKKVSFRIRSGMAKAGDFVAEADIPGSVKDAAHFLDRMVDKGFAETI